MTIIEATYVLICIIRDLRLNRLLKLQTMEPLVILNNPSIQPSITFKMSFTSISSTESVRKTFLEHKLTFMGHVITISNSCTCLHFNSYSKSKGMLFPILEQRPPGWSSGLHHKTIVLYISASGLSLPQHTPMLSH